MCLAVPGEIVSIEGSDPISRTARVSFGGTLREVNLACVPEASVGDFVLVHVGLAISVVDRKEAEEVLEMLRRLGPDVKGDPD
jgi:hydrogenase expression/formation protein HypC